MDEKTRKYYSEKAEAEKRYADRYKSGKSSFRASDGFGPGGKTNTPKQQRNIDRRRAEDNRYYNDPKARTERANAERDNARKSADRLKPPAAPATPAPSAAKQSAISKLLKTLKGGKGLGALGIVGSISEGGKAFTQKKPSSKDPSGKFQN
jgi:hypothetical protein